MKTLILAAVAALFVTPVAAQSCVSIEEDKVKAEAAGTDYLGARTVPFVDGPVIFYQKDGITYFSAVINGCVDPQAFPIGIYKPEVNV